jgi:hypothetical protein
MGSHPYFRHLAVGQRRREVETRVRVEDTIPLRLPRNEPGRGWRSKNASKCVKRFPAI